jgi:hypothetical protein
MFADETFATQSIGLTSQPRGGLARRSVLHHLGASEQHVQLAVSLYVQHLAPVHSVNRLLHLRHRLACHRTNRT